jgi:hypothetical protein
MECATDSTDDHAEWAGDKDAEQWSLVGRRRKYHWTNESSNEANSAKGGRSLLKKDCKYDYRHQGVSGMAAATVTTIRRVRDMMPIRPLTVC